MKNKKESIHKKRSTQKILTILIWVVLVFFLIQSGYLFSINTITNEVGIAGDTVKFKTPGYVLTMIRGKPDEKEKYEEYGAVKYTYYDQNLFGDKGKISYHCQAGVNEVEVVIPVEPEKREDKFNDICNYMCEVYSKKEGYYDEGISEQAGILYRNIGAEFGATGIAVWITCEEDRIEIVANYQY